MLLFEKPFTLAFIFQKKMLTNTSNYSSIVQVFSFLSFVKSLFGPAKANNKVRRYDSPGTVKAADQSPHPIMTLV